MPDDPWSAFDRRKLPPVGTRDEFTDVSHRPPRFGFFRDEAVSVLSRRSGDIEPDGVWLSDSYLRFAEAIPYCPSPWWSPVAFVSLVFAWPLVDAHPSPPWEDPRSISLLSAASSRFRWPGGHRLSP